MPPGISITNKFACFVQEFGFSARTWLFFVIWKGPMDENRGQ